jgi:prephenate dehydratase
MADEITRVDYYMGLVPNKAGEGARVLRIFTDAGINLTGFLGYPKTARNSEVVFIVDEKTPPLASIAKKAGLALGKKQKAFFTTGEDRPGAVTETMSRLAAAGINVMSCHAMCAGAGRYGALVVVDWKHLRKAAKALGI